MGRSKDDFIRATGGYRIDEIGNPDKFPERMSEIGRLETALLSPTLTFEQRESVHRQLCALKGIDLDEYEPPDD